MAKRTYTGGFGKAPDRLRQDFKFGIKGDNFSSVEAARNAVANAQNYDINRVWGTTGVTGRTNGTRYELDRNGQPIAGKSSSLFGPAGSATMGGTGRTYFEEGYYFGSVDILDQEQAPENPGIRKQAFSTYGITIPLSIGSRRISGNILEATDIEPVLEGTYKYTVDYEIPIFAASGEGPS